jgi:hypothetical protein
MPVSGSRALCSFGKNADGIAPPVSAGARSVTGRRRCTRPICSRISTVVGVWIGSERQPGLPCSTDFNAFLPKLHSAPPELTRTITPASRQVSHGQRLSRQTLNIPDISVVAGEPRWLL